MTLRNKTVLAPLVPRAVDPTLPEPAPVHDDQPELTPDDHPQRRPTYLLAHRGVLILVLGILAFWVMPIILGPMAWAMGSHDLREMREGRMDPEGEGLTNAGRVCGMIVTLVYVLLGSLCMGMLLPYILFVFFAGTSGSIQTSPR
jgi:hypothetical protein